MKKITLENGKTVEISDESYNNLAKATTSSMPWRAKYVEIYWFVNDIGGFRPTIDRYHCPDDFHYAIGNYYQTQEKAQKEADRLHALGRVRLAILEANKGWEPDWEDEKQIKYLILRNEKEEFFGRAFTFREKVSNELPYMQSEEIAEKIIEDHAKDLKLIFGVE